jgi:hypothetical protein
VAAIATPAPTAARALAKAFLAKAPLNTIEKFLACRWGGIGSSRTLKAAKSGDSRYGREREEEGRERGKLQLESRTMQHKNSTMHIIADHSKAPENIEKSKHRNKNK